MREMRARPHDLMSRVSSIGAILALAGLAAAPASGATLILDPFEYASDAEAQAAWLNRGGSPKVTMADSGAWGTERVMTLPCNFSALPDRCYWDRLDAFNLSDYAMFALEIYVPDPDAVSQFTLYFGSGGGWYSQSWPITQSGWQTLTFNVSEFAPLGTPAGWDQIDTIRLSPWRGSTNDAELAVSELRAYQPQVFILHDTETTETALADRSADLVHFMLSEYDVSVGVFDGAAIDDGYLDDSKLLVLPYNDVYTDAQLTAIEDFVDVGGKLMVYYRLPARIATLLGLANLGSASGVYRSYEFDDAVITHLPDSVRQHSHVATVIAPLPTLNARMIAEWEDDQGVKTGRGAWYASDTGTFKSHVLHVSDRVNKQKMLLGLIGHYVPEIWPDASARAIERIGLIAEYPDYVSAVADIQARAPSTPRLAEINAALANADTARTQAMNESSAGQHADAVWSAIDARSHMQDAYAMSQLSALPEYRSVWEHSGTGPTPGDWQRAIDTMVAHGFSAIYPNSLRAGLAHYDSALLPVSSEYNNYGDQITAVVNAARPKGIEVHVWKVNWNLGKAPQSFIDQMRAEERLQVSAFGAELEWLCPSHPDNQTLEHDSMMEVVQNYDVDGIHFDYIRYPGPDYCYCDGCRTRFEQDTGNSVTNWPADVRAGGPLEMEFLPWRREQITKLVQAVHTSVKAYDSDVRVSAAVYGDYDQAFGNVGQDWVDWIDRGIVDHLHPMSTTPDYDRLRELIDAQLTHAAGRIPIYPGIGVSNDATHLEPDATIAQVLITREKGTGGFIMFQYDVDFGEHQLPALGQGTTLPAAIGGVPTGSLVPGTMLTVEKGLGGKLDLAWGDTCAPTGGPSDYAVYRGNLPAGGGWAWNHTPVRCGTGGDTFATIASDPGDHYFLVVPNDSNREGRYGFDSDGSPRAASAVPCLPQSYATCP